MHSPTKNIRKNNMKKQVLCTLAISAALFVTGKVNAQQRVQYTEPAGTVQVMSKPATAAPATQPQVVKPGVQPKPVQPTQKPATCAPTQPATPGTIVRPVSGGPGVIVRPTPPAYPSKIQPPAGAFGTNPAPGQQVIQPIQKKPVPAPQPVEVRPGVGNRPGPAPNNDRFRHGK